MLKFMAMVFVYISNYRQQDTAKNTGWTLERWNCTLKFPIDSAKSSMGTSEKMHAILSKLKLLQLFFINLESNHQLTWAHLQETINDTSIFSTVLSINFDLKKCILVQMSMKISINWPIILLSIYMYIYLVHLVKLHKWAATKWVCTQRRLRSAWASAQSAQCLRCPHEESLGP